MGEDGPVVKMGEEETGAQSREAQAGLGSAGPRVERGSPGPTRAAHALPGHRLALPASPQPQVNFSSFSCSQPQTQPEVAGEEQRGIFRALPPGHTLR